MIVPQLSLAHQYLEMFQQSLLWVVILWGALTQGTL
jgi:hypothetical protein